MKPNIHDVVHATFRLYGDELLKSINTSALLRQRFMQIPPPKPLTRMERLKRRIQDAKDAIRVLRGDAMHIDWYE